MNGILHKRACTPFLKPMQWCSGRVFYFFSILLFIICFFGLSHIEISNCLRFIIEDFFQKTTILLQLNLYLLAAFGIISYIFRSGLISTKQKNEFHNIIKNKLEITIKKDYADDSSSLISDFCDQSKKEIKNELENFLFYTERVFVLNQKLIFLSLIISAYSIAFCLLIKQSETTFHYCITALSVAFLFFFYQLLFTLYSSIACFFIRKALTNPNSAYERYKNMIKNARPEQNEFIKQIQEACRK